MSSALLVLEDCFFDENDESECFTIVDAEKFTKDTTMKLNHGVLQDAKFSKGSKFKKLP
jgi:hypothetical protein